MVVGGILAVHALSRSRRAGILPGIGVFAICAVVGLYITVVSDPWPPFEDFRYAYYTAGQIVLNDPGALSSEFDRGLDGFVNLPIVAYLFSPLALLPESPAVVAFLILGLVAVVGAYRMLVKVADIDGRARWLLLFLFVANGPLLNSLKEGNTVQFLLLALVGGLYLLQTGRPVWAGVLLGVAAVIKLPLALFGVYLVVRRLWGAAFGFAAAVASAVLLSLAVFGWEMHRRWFSLEILGHSQEAIAAFNNQSILAFMARLTVSPIKLDSWEPVDPAEVDPWQHTVASRLPIVLLLVAVVACVWGRAAWRADDRGDRSSALKLEYVLVLMLAILSSPLTWTHYYAWVLIPIAFLVSPRSPLARGVVPRALAWLATLLITPVVFQLFFTSDEAVAFYAEFASSGVLFGGLIWFVVIVWSRIRVARRADRREPGRGNPARRRDGHSRVDEFAAPEARYSA